MSEDLSERGEDGMFVATNSGRVSAHLGNVYLSFEPDEAIRLGLALLSNAAKVQAEQSLREHAVAVERAEGFNPDDNTRDLA